MTQVIKHYGSKFKNQDVNTGSLTRPFALLPDPWFACLFVYSLPSLWESESLDGCSCCFFFQLITNNHSAKAITLTSNFSSTMQSVLSIIFWGNSAKKNPHYQNTLSRNPQQGCPLGSHGNRRDTGNRRDRSHTCTHTRAHTCTRAGNKALDFPWKVSFQAFTRQAYYPWHG